ncbi:isochorismatase family protein [uncultured Reyranella sp.]|jgi:nicotinamidase-related amidase|uniref:isochorismatase family protein n=1 Tax=uncultured Reyranella sp. TaxID=735512 RepID=UPI00259CADB1|nr:isochorismatase family protein [uncultured Reyranella sp.]
METSTKTARQLYEELKADPRRRRFGFGRKPALVNVDLQNAYTRPAEFPTAYQTDPRQIEYVNGLARRMRTHGCPVIWTFVAYLDSGEDCGVWGTRADLSRSLRSITAEDQRSRLDDRCDIDRERDIVMNKRMASAFFETNLGSLLTYHRVDTVIVTGGSTSGCVRATVVDSLSRSFRTIVPEECVADKHESPHFANLYDMMAKYADVLTVAEVVDFLERYEPLVS